jgi:hypothetical protein
MQTPEEIVTSGETETPVVTETLEGIGTNGEIVEETITPVTAGGTEEMQTENITGGEVEAVTGHSTVTEPRTYLIRLREYVFIPSDLETIISDLAVWRNCEDSLLSPCEEGLF